MDCRTARMWFGLGLVLSLAGCTHTKPPLASNDQQDQKAVAALPRKKTKDLPKRQPLPETCVAFGDFKLRESKAPGKTAAEQQQMREEARKAYEQALQIDPKCTDAHRGLSRIYAAEENNDQAIRVLQSGVKVQPRDAAMWLDLGMLHARKKEWDPAVAAFSQAVELVPQNRQYANMLGYCLARCGRIDDCLACFARVGGEARAHYNVARMMQHLQREDLCRVHLQLALEKQPDLTEAKDMLAQLDTAAKGGVVQAKHEVEEQR